MKMTMKFATGVVAEGITPDGKRVKIKSLELQPFFLTAKGQSELLSIKSISNNEVDIEELAFLVSGTTGKLAKKDRSFVAESVVAVIDQAPPAPPTAPVEPLPESSSDESDDGEEEDEFEETD